MPQDNPRSDNQRTESRSGESTRSERARERSAGVISPPFGEMGTHGITAGLRLQKEMIELLSEMSREWYARATSEAELAMGLSNRLTAARSVPDALSAYQEWLNEWMGMFGEDSRRLVSDGRKLMEASARCFSDAPVAMS
ncbi:MAG TPA: hypothetical protein VMF12_01745 [Xanthobacteraceae bacterium]|nr:hypothetical protein [Xanthobacteraceae bacterium]